MALREFLLPDLGEGLEDAEVVAWRVAEGDTVELNQTLVEVNTAKALVEIPAPWGGVVEALHAAEGDVVKVGQPLVTIRVSAEAAGEARPSEPSPIEAPREGVQTAMEAGAQAGEEERPKRRAVLVGYGVEEEREPEPSRAARSTRSPGGDARGRDRAGPVPASPPVRRLARELGIDLASVEGSASGGRVTREDVLRAAQGERPEEAGIGERGTAGVVPAAAIAEEEQRIPVRGTRRLIAEKMSRSVREIPHVTTFLTVDATWLEAFREQISTDSGQRVSPLPVVVRGLVEVCKEHRKLNSSFDADNSEIVLRDRYHVGIATDTEQGLLVPVVRDAAELGVVELGAEIARLTQAARAGRAQPQELVGGTITVTNVGTFGAEFGTPVINHPEAAILALGVIEPRALVVEGRVEARPAVTLSLSFDHRVLDGAEAGRALRALKDLLENPLRLGSLPL